MTKMSDEVRARATTALFGTDELNPNMIFQGTSGYILLLIADGAIDPVQLAKDELASRGVNQDGEWIGFPAAAALWQTGRR